MANRRSTLQRTVLSSGLLLLSANIVHAQVSGIVRDAVTLAPPEELPPPTDAAVKTDQSSIINGQNDNNGHPAVVAILIVPTPNFAQNPTAAPAALPPTVAIATNQPAQVVNVTGTPAVALRFNSNAATRLAKASTENAGQGIAIVVDFDVIDAPILREPIRNGAMLLSGGLTLQQANDLAKLLRAGTSMPMTVIEEETIRPR